MGTSNLRLNLDKCKKRKFRDNGQRILDCNASGSLAKKVPEFSPTAFRELLATAIVRHELPLQFAEYEGVRKCFEYLYPEVNVVSKNTIESDNLQMYKREKAKVKETLKSAPGRIALTSDCWSSITTDGYLSLTAHFVDENWCLQKLILNFRHLPPPNTGFALCNEVCTMLKDWNIQKKVFSITLDNPSSNDCIADLLRSQMDLISGGIYFHVPCCAHFINLIAQDGLEEVDVAIDKVRESVKYCKGSQSTKQMFLACVSRAELQSNMGLRQDIPTRWNSTYFMLDSILYYKNAFNYLQRTDANYVHCPTSEEWGKIEKIAKFLKFFYEVTCLFSGSKHPTTNLYFPSVLKVGVLLKQETESQDGFIKKMATRMFTKFEKYWDELSTIMAIAAILDPRYKLQIVEWGFKKIYGFGYDIALSTFKEKLYSLFNEYKTESAVRKACDEAMNINQDNHDYSDYLLKDFDDFSNKLTSQAVKSELDTYLDELLMPRTNKLNILEYWREQEVRYPTLAMMARDILAVPISTVASEAAFSTGGKVLDPYRSSLKPSTVEAIICLKDWMFGEANMEPQLEELCGSIVNLKFEDETESPTQTESPAETESPNVTAGFSPGTQDSNKI